MTWDISLAELTTTMTRCAQLHREWISYNEHLPDLGIFIDVFNLETEDYASFTLSVQCYHKDCKFSYTIVEDMT